MLKELVITMGNRLIVLFLAAAGSAFGIYFQLPIGALIGSFILVAIAQISGLGAKKLHKNTRRGIQMLIGGFIGLNVNSERINELVYLIAPGILLALLHIIFALLLAFILTKYFHLDVVTALCGSIPAGMSEITVIANQTHADVEFVILMHLFRLSTVVAIFPFLVHLFQ